MDEPFADFCLAARRLSGGGSIQLQTFRGMRSSAAADRRRTRAIRPGHLVAFRVAVATDSGCDAATMCEAEVRGEGYGVPRVRATDASVQCVELMEEFFLEKVPTLLNEALGPLEAERNALRERCASLEQTLQQGRKLYDELAERHTELQDFAKLQEDDEDDEEDDAR
eukprot:TRINITY_DN76939_c0_g1_i1.p2 TRINITY_DN76939_c0_g1~~TRINITY_DN76939_c0_g1_i1.p2  ORF type:complete len:181 (+),score=42.46 TRINITY_DN76939_c0_g1_i1:40-543(+)